MNTAEGFEGHLDARIPLGDDSPGLHLIANPKDPSLESVRSPIPVRDTADNDSIVVVHGLDGHWKRSFTAPNGIFWPQDLLPQLVPAARIYSFAHDSRTRGSNEPLTLDISDHGRDLVAELAMARQLSKVGMLCAPSLTPSGGLTYMQTQRIPITFVGHSLGGLIIKSVS